MISAEYLVERTASVLDGNDTKILHNVAIKITKTLSLRRVIYDFPCSHENPHTLAVYRVEHRCICTHTRAGSVDITRTHSPMVKACGPGSAGLPAAASTGTAP